MWSVNNLPEELHSQKKKKNRRHKFEHENLNKSLEKIEEKPKSTRRGGRKLFTCQLNMLISYKSLEIY